MHVNARSGPHAVTSVIPFILPASATAHERSTWSVVRSQTVLALAEVGPGDLSLDHALGTEREGPFWALAALVTGAIGAIGAHLVAGPAPEPVESPESPPAEDSVQPNPAAAE